MVKIEMTEKTNTDNAKKVDNINFWLIMSVISNCVGMCVRDFNF